MHLQFIVDNKTKRIVSGEALSRWETSEGEVIMPGKYIGVMEKSGLLINFDYYMFECVCDKLSKWAKTDFKNLQYLVTLRELLYPKRILLPK